MTPHQYYFPYFFNIDDFNKSLKEIGLVSYLTPENGVDASQLVIGKIDSDSISAKVVEIKSQTTLMIQDESLIYWQTDYNLIKINKLSLLDSSDIFIIETDTIRLNIDELGISKQVNVLKLKSLVTFTRIEELQYEQDYYEQFVIVIIDRGQLKSIPFEWFNKTGGDWGYVWPATARIDTKTNKLYGRGMRMSDFVLDL